MKKKINRSCIQVINISLLPGPNDYSDDTAVTSPTPKYTGPKIINSILSKKEKIHPHSGSTTKNKK